jgi:hypothetical protein
MSKFRDYLNKFNRKERFFLIGMALGKPKFELADSFRQKLNEIFNIEIPENAFTAMDYHLNWIYAAATCAFSNSTPVKIFDNKSGIIDGTQEDVDLIVAFEDESGISHLIMIEAKGVTSFTNKQFIHKMDRLKAIFGEDGKRFGDNIKLYFVLVSPDESERLRVEHCPSWLKQGEKIHWIKLIIPKDRLIVYGCNEKKKSDKSRAFWTIKEDPHNRKD